MVRASSLVYIGVRLTFAALIVAFGTYMLRKWNPGHNEPREQGDEAEAEVVETLVEVKEEAVDAAGRGGKIVGQLALQHARALVAKDAAALNDVSARFDAIGMKRSAADAAAQANSA